MRNSTSWIVAGLISMASLPVAAGVVIVERETSPDGKGGIKTVTRTTYVEGGRQKVVTPDSVMITDLDKGLMIWLDEKQKVASETTMAQAAEGAQAMQAMGLEMTPKVTGRSRTVAGYSCDEYEMTAKIMGSEVTTVTCLSKSAPGAAEYSEFGKRMMARSGIKPPPGGFPAGVTLATVATTKAGVPPGMPAEFAKMIADQMAKNGPQVTRTEVTSIKVQSLPADTFAVPAGYTRKKVSMGGN